MYKSKNLPLWLGFVVQGHISKWEVDAGQTHVIYVSFILDAGGRPHTESPQVRLIGVMKQMTFQEIPYVDNGQLSL